MIRKAVFPGSFDPVTLGHLDIIERALPLFDEIVIAIGQNSAKNYMFELQERVKFLTESFKNEPKITVATYTGLTAEFCQKINAPFILRGLRNFIDLEFEKTIGQSNFQMTGVETVFLISSPGKSHISSSVVRDIRKNNGNYSFLVPPSVPKK